MDFTYNETQIQIRDAIQKICDKYGDDYWLKKDKEGGFPEEFIKDIRDEGWLGIAMPTEYGGSNLGITEAAIMMQTIARSGGGLSACSAIHINIFTPKPIVAYANEAQKKEWIPALIEGRDRTCFAVTEPNSGLDTTHLQTRAVKDGDNYIVNGRKIFISTAQTANKMLLLARTKPIESTPKPIDGLSLFYTDLDRNYIEMQEIDKMGRKAVDTNMLFIDGLPVPKEHLIGEEGMGFRYMIQGFNPERILVAAEAVGLGQAALRKATEYAKERVVFGRPIGQNQAIQHPLAASWAELEAANMMVFKAASLFDNNQSCGAEANAAKYLAAEAGFRACERAVMTHGGMGYAREYHVERYLREIFIPRIAPVSRELILSFISENVLGLPKSY